MGQNKYENYRIGSFAAVNTGKIIGCSANTHFKAKYSGSGFVYDNKGQILNSVSVKPVRGKNKLAGFVFRNTGNIQNSGFVGTVKKNKKEDADTKDSKSKYVDENLLIDDSTPTEQIYKQLKLDEAWKNENHDSLEPCFKSNHVDLASDEAENVVEISTAQELLDIIRDINDGEESAAKAHYVLTSNINLGGKSINPIGASEYNAFRGTFDGRGKCISNFSIKAKGLQCAGFFGFVKDAKIINLKIDCIVNGTGGDTVGAMVGVNNNSHFENCAVFTNMKPGLCCGQFVGKNGGVIINCYVCGKILFPILLWPFILLAILLLLLLLIPLGIRLFKDDGGYVPEVIDPNQVPIVEKDNIGKPAEGTSRISFEVNHEVYIGASTGVGQMGYRNPARATQDVVVHIVISDSELVKAGYDLTAIGVRTAEEMAAAGYNADTAYTELYRSGLVQVGYAIDNCKLSALPNGEMLKLGSYEVLLLIDGYDPETHERSIINTNVPVTIHVVEG